MGFSYFTWVDDHAPIDSRPACGAPTPIFLPYHSFVGIPLSPSCWIGYFRCHVFPLCSHPLGLHVGYDESCSVIRGNAPSFMLPSCFKIIVLRMGWRMLLGMAYDLTLKDTSPWWRLSSAALQEHGAADIGAKPFAGSIESVNSPAKPKLHDSLGFAKSHKTLRVYCIASSRGTDDVRACRDIGRLLDA